MFDSINLENELFKIRQNNPQEELDSVLEAFKDLFRAEWESEKRITDTLQNGSPNQYTPSFEKLNPDRIFELSDIKKLCLKYRLRFLPTKHFSADRKSTRLNSSHVRISYAVFCLKKKKKHVSILYYKILINDHTFYQTTLIPGLYTYTLLQHRLTPFASQPDPERTSQSQPIISPS